MQMTIDDLHIPGMQKQVTSHSLRYGGATMLAAAGFPHYVIAIYGGWAEDSKTLRVYTKVSEQMISVVSTHMALMGSLNASSYFINDAFIINKGK